jgi:hypothetical protein
MGFDGEVSFGCISGDFPHWSKKFNYDDQVCEGFKLYAHFLLCFRNWDLYQIRWHRNYMAGAGL